MDEVRGGLARYSERTGGNERAGKAKGALVGEMRGLARDQSAIMVTSAGNSSPPAASLLAFRHRRRDTRYDFAGNSSPPVVFPLAFITEGEIRDTTLLGTPPPSVDFPLAFRGRWRGWGKVRLQITREATLGVK